MNKLLCKMFGHKYEKGISIEEAWYCKRCGHYVPAVMWPRVQRRMLGKFRK